MVIELFKARKQVEERIYKVLDILDPSHKNSDFYKHKFARYSDKEFIEFFKQDFTIKYQVEVFKTEPTMEKIKKALDYLKVPMLERMRIPNLYKDEDGNAPYTKEVLVVYTPCMKMQQFNIKKSSMSTDISKRSMTDGLLMMQDKNGNTSDREFESLVVIGAEKTMKELSTIRADSMTAKGTAINKIATTGILSQKDYEVTREEALARNKLNVYFLGAGLNSNLINEGDYLINTLKKQGYRKTTREK